MKPTYEVRYKSPGGDEWCDAFKTMRGAERKAAIYREAPSYFKDVRIVEVQFKVLKA